ncbi:signal peptidase I [Roseibacillus ishigakijimensis]|uniref:Signal peptidase I n=1 Tax=Roseibacillus ishigakijimensis TaxID=454146 RepID=A0A934RQ22_9BACT|nr:signal peptidase I [Roseibacillus ishigakijimensis]MBK1833757.1 signal peptidase I [Roseibacillus ishigakijimensis]
MIKAAHIPQLVLDAFWKPKWKKEALGTLKGGQKFLNYKRDLLEPDRIREIQSRIKDLKVAITERDQTAVKEACKQLQGTCEHSLKSYRPPDALAENLEVMFVAIAVALGIRAYYIQPFRIPTGSMQPTLNGIVGHSIDEKSWDKPNFVVQGFHKVTEGRTYVKAIAPADTEIVDIVESRWMWFFTRTTILFGNGEKLTLSGSKNAIVNGLGMGKRLNFYTNDGEFYGFERADRMGPRARRFPVKEGQILAQGWVDTGDLVLVDKFSYHFRTPKRGEVFVFETRGIENIISEYRNRDQEAGSHYIKRLAGVPGDELRLDPPHLWVNGKLASEKGFKRVASQENGYEGYVSPGSQTGRYLTTPQDRLTLGEEQYFALGDNSANSSDSRYWGEIDEYLLVGPGLFTLWPFENFGFIR